MANFVSKSNSSHLRSCWMKSTIQFSRKSSFFYKNSTLKALFGIFGLSKLRCKKQYYALKHLMPAYWLKAVDWIFDGSYPRNTYAGNSLWSKEKINTNFRLFRREDEANRCYDQWYFVFWEPGKNQNLLAWFLSSNFLVFFSKTSMFRY